LTEQSLRALQQSSHLVIWNIKYNSIIEFSRVVEEIMPDLLKNQPALTSSRLRFLEFLQFIFMVRRQWI